MTDLPERYVLLCLRAGRLVDGFIDLYFGPPELEARVGAEEPMAPRALQEEAVGLLDELPRADLEEDRVRWLEAQLRAIECVTSRLAGDDWAWSDEVERCLGIPPTFTDTAVFEEAHRRLDAALEGAGTLRERYISWDRDNAVPADRLIPALENLRPILRERTAAIVELPPDESVTYELVSGKPWLAYNWYKGGHRSVVEVNADLPISVNLLADLVAHEAYPGHHTEHAAKEARLWEDLGRVETTVAIVAAPEALISEGIAMSAMEQALGDDAFDVVGDRLGELGVEIDTAVAAEIYRAEQVLFAVMVNAAFLIHERGGSEREAGEYMREWGLESDERAERAVAFVTDPTWRGYVPSYMEGRRLCRGFIDRAPGNFTRLLTEQLTTADLIA